MKSSVHYRHTHDLQKREKRLRVYIKYRADRRKSNFPQICSEPFLIPRAERGVPGKRPVVMRLHRHTQHLWSPKNVFVYCDVFVEEFHIFCASKWQRCLDTAVWKNQESFLSLRSLSDIFFWPAVWRWKLQLFFPTGFYLEVCAAVQPVVRGCLCVVGGKRGVEVQTSDTSRCCLDGWKVFCRSPHSCSLCYWSVQCIYSRCFPRMRT